MELSNKSLLEKLITIQGVSGDESRIKTFIKDYVLEHSKNWKCKPILVEGRGFQDTLILIFGKPRTAIYAHTDTIGYTVAYENELIPIGGPDSNDGIQLIGEDSKGIVEGQLMILETEEHRLLKLITERTVDRGTLLSFKPTVIETDEYIQSAYLDNRLGVYVALKLAETIENGAIVFSTYEEHGGNSVGFCAKYLYNSYEVNQALICDITWVTEGVKHGEGVAISMRDSMIPRRKYLKKILAIANQSEVPFQLEVESSGGSDGSSLQKSDLPIDWCFIGAAEDHVHSPNERVHKKDIHSMIKLYQHLMQEL